MNDNVELKEAVRIRNAMASYQDQVYLNLIRQLNSNCQDVLKENLGREFVCNCAHDIAGEIVRNCFDTSEYNITVDQLARRMLFFTYENEYDPLNEVGGTETIRKNIYNCKEIKSSELKHISDLIDQCQEKLFTEDRKKDKLDGIGKSKYRYDFKEQNGGLRDELTGAQEEKKTIKDGRQRSDLQADHVQAREPASYSSRYVTDIGKAELKLFWNSGDNMQLINESANTSKGDVRVCRVDEERNYVNINIKTKEIKYVNTKNTKYNPDTDITYKATPEQLADATIYRWEKQAESCKAENNKKIENLKRKGYLNQDGKVPKAVRQELIRNIRSSQNAESMVILRNTDYKQVADDAFDSTASAIGKIISGQILYYAAPPLIYETKCILADKNITIENALNKLGQASKRIGKYVLSKLENIFVNIAFNSLKKFIKSFMDILISLIKATIKKILKTAKKLLLSTVDAIRIIADNNASSSEKADAVFNLYGVTITSCVVEILFELAADALHLPSPFDDIVFGSLQILTTVVCTNLTMLILKKADLFDVQFGFKMTRIRELFDLTREEYEKEYICAKEYADTEISQIIDYARGESIEIYHNLEEIDIKKHSARKSLETINTMFSMNIDFEEDWLKFIGAVSS